MTLETSFCDFLNEASYKYSDLVQFQRQGECHSCEFRGKEIYKQAWKSLWAPDTRYVKIFLLLKWFKCMRGGMHSTILHDKYKNWHVSQREVINARVARDAYFSLSWLLSYVYFPRCFFLGSTILFSVSVSSSDWPVGAWKAACSWFLGLIAWVAIPSSPI